MEAVAPLASVKVELPLAEVFRDVQFEPPPLPPPPAGPGEIPPPPEQ